MTPRQYALLLKRYEFQRKSEDRRSGEIVAMLYNLNRDPEKDPNGLDWQDVFPEWKEQEREQTEEEMLEMMRIMVKRTEGLPA